LADPRHHETSLKRLDKRIIQRMYLSDKYMRTYGDICLIGSAPRPHRPRSSSSSPPPRRRPNPWAESTQEPQNVVDPMLSAEALDPDVPSVLDRIARSLTAVNTRLAVLEEDVRTRSNINQPVSPGMVENRVDESLRRAPTLAMRGRGRRTRPGRVRRQSWSLTIEGEERPDVNIITTPVPSLNGPQRDARHQLQVRV
jgi:hypothetical protein